jgi:hypothetical protein
MSMFKKTTLALAISALAGGALAQSAPAPAPAPATSPITANVTVVQMTIVIAVSANQTLSQPFKAVLITHMRAVSISVTGTRVLVGLVMRCMALMAALLEKIHSLQ